MYDKCYFCLDQLPKLKKESTASFFRKFWRSRGTKEPAYITVEEEKTISMFKVMICNVFVCNVWKAAGLFADINNQVSYLAIISFSHNLLDAFMILCFRVLCIIVCCSFQINCGETSVNDNYRLAHYRFTFYNNIPPAHTNKHTARRKTYKQTHTLPYKPKNI